MNSRTKGKQGKSHYVMSVCSFMPASSISALSVWLCQA